MRSHNHTQFRRSLTFLALTLLFVKFQLHMKSSSEFPDLTQSLNHTMCPCPNLLMFHTLSPELLMFPNLMKSEFQFQFLLPWIAHTQSRRTKMYLDHTPCLLRTEFQFPSTSQSMSLDLTQSREWSMFHMKSADHTLSTDLLMFQFQFRLFEQLTDLFPNLSLNKSPIQSMFLALTQSTDQFLFEFQCKFQCITRELFAKLLRSMFVLGALNKLLHVLQLLHVLLHMLLHALLLHVVPMVIRDDVSYSCCTFVDLFPLNIF